MQYLNIQALEFRAKDKHRSKTSNENKEIHAKNRNETKRAEKLITETLNYDFFSNYSLLFLC